MGRHSHPHEWGYILHGHVFRRNYFPTYRADISPTGSNPFTPNRRQQQLFFCGTPATYSQPSKPAAYFGDSPTWRPCPLSVIPEKTQGGIQMSNNTKAWIKGIISALITGFTTAITTLVVAPETFNATPEGIKKTLIVATVSSALSVANYLKASPLPPDDTLPLLKG
jgi:hypothetical protein